MGDSSRNAVRGRLKINCDPEHCHTRGRGRSLVVGQGEPQGDSEATKALQRMLSPTSGIDREDIVNVPKQSEAQEAPCDANEGCGEPIPSIHAGDRSERSRELLTDEHLARARVDHERGRQIEVIDRQRATPIGGREITLEKMQLPEAPGLDEAPRNFEESRDAIHVDARLREVVNDTQFHAAGSRELRDAKTSGGHQRQGMPERARCPHPAQASLVEGLAPNGGDGLELIAVQGPTRLPGDKRRHEGGCRKSQASLIEDRLTNETRGSLLRGGNRA
jgi:hypothetical protein